MAVTGFALTVAAGLAWVFRGVLTSNNAKSTFERPTRTEGHVPTDADWREARMLIYGGVLALAVVGAACVVLGATGVVE